MGEIKLEFNSETLSDSNSTPTCSICGGTCVSRHFGALSCHACAAFFRRSVAFKRAYICRNQRNCKLIGVPARQICRFCRMHTCIAVGMRISEVKSTAGNSPAPHSSSGENGVLCPTRSSSEGSTSPANSGASSSPSTSLVEISPVPGIPDNVLGDLLKSRRMLFYNRVKFGMFKCKNTRNNPATLHSMLHTMSIEAQVMYNFLESSKVMDIFGTEENLTVMMRHFLPTWAKMETFQNTAKQGGIAINRIYCLNEDYIDLDKKFLESFYKAETSLSNPQELAQIESQYYQKMFEGAITLVKHELDDYEFTALVQITLIRMASELFSDNLEIKSKLQKYLRMLMRALQTHYHDNYSDVAVKMGNLVLLVGEMQELRRRYNERVIQLDLSSVWTTGAGAHDHSPYKMEKHIFDAETRNPITSSGLWLPCSVPLELTISRAGKMPDTSPHFPPISCLNFK